MLAYSAIYSQDEDGQLDGPYWFEWFDGFIFYSVIIPI